VYTSLHGRETRHGLIVYQSKCHIFNEEGRYEPGGRKNQEYTMVGRFNRPVNFGNSRGIISTVYILVGSFLTSLLLLSIMHRSNEG
jgi:hypothetical protein